MFPTKVPWVVLSLLLAGCQPGAGNQGPAVSAAKGLPKYPSSAPSAPAATPPPHRPLQWTADRRGQGASVHLKRGDGLLMEITCSANPQRLTVKVPGFQRIGSEDRLSFGFDDEPMALAADLQAASPGVSAHGPIPTDIAARIRNAHTVSARYGNQNAGPYPALDGGPARVLASICADIVAVDPPVLDERPATADSAQAAATVVERYLGLMAAGDTDAAARLWGESAQTPDGAAEQLREQLARYSDLRSEVYAPGRIGGAAGSLYVTVPARITGRSSGGRGMQQSVMVTLRRANDVPGSTQAQRRWHIEKVELGTDGDG